MLLEYFKYIFYKLLHFIPFFQFASLIYILKLRSTQLYIKHFYLNAHNYLFNIKSDPPWRTEDIMQKCLDRLESTNGPVVYKSGEIQEYGPSMGLVFPKERPCKIEIRNYTEKSITDGLGCYYGYGHVLTALHVIKDTGPGKCKILIAFTTGEIMLVYKADFTESFNIGTDRDLAFIKLLGDTSPLGDGLQNQIGKVSETESVDIYPLGPDGNFLKKKGKICYPNLSMKAQMYTEEFIISVAGKPGDSGSPVYNTKGELIGIYRGIFTHPECEYGRCSKISPQFLLWIQTSYCSFTFCNATSDLQKTDSCLVDIN
ncbi:uncharacterized protein LOC117595685 [Pangasianodon hypophthalmus]|uniref:uncharacterized protein LOC117595685 n=1 Tax=Pangasianodon hypophthalmus TaxID=310915 RepID=UPI002307EFE8|nr:uncharacterized protein LOC117595685 [Pangasianodon hypophthalmus]XP_053092009.1 uncharacterized protein LOC117595685 [Pangasianodon hypophthalmus]